MDFQEYLEVEAANSGLLKNMMRSPAHGKAYLDSQKVETQPLAFGTLTHTAILEPERLFKEYASAPDFGHLIKTDTTSSEEAKENRERKKAFEEANQDKKIISASDFKAMTGILESVYAHDAARDLIQAVDEVEKTILWKDEETGLDCKGRIDMWSNAGTFALDLKTTRDARYFSFRKDAENFGYLLQGSFYFRGLWSLGYLVTHFAWIVVEKEAPYAVQVFNLPESTREKYKRVIDSLLKKYKVCKKSNYWPGYGSAINNLDLSDYHANQLEELL